MLNIMELSFVLMEPYHRLLRKREWSMQDQEKARRLNEREDLSWTTYYRGVSLSVHLVAIELDYRLRGKDYSILTETRETEYASVYSSFDHGTAQENRDRRKIWFYLCDHHALVHCLQSSWDEALEEDA